MQKQVLKDQSPPSSQDQQQDCPPILCDGCWCLIEEDKYIRHWEICIIKTRKEQRRKREEKRIVQQKLERENVIKLQKRQLEKEQVKQLLSMNCQKCGQEVSPGSNSISQHRKNCKQKQEMCEFCLEVFLPTYLMSQHHKICETKKVIQMSIIDPHNSSEQIDHSEQDQLSTMLQSDPRVQQLLSLLSNNTANNQSQGTNQVNSNPNSDLLEDFYRAFKKKQNFTSKQIDLLKHHHFLSTTQENCSICSSPIEAKEQVITLKCSHIFHQKCIKQWLRKAVTCPNCNLRLKDKLS